MIAATTTLPEAIAPPRVILTGYTPRTFQDRIHRKLKRFNALVIHRRAGKSVLAINTLIDAAIRTKKLAARFGYVAPFLKQARQIAWEYLKAYTRNIPGVEVHESLLAVTFANGAEVRLYGADNPDALRGIYLDGVVLDEYADMRPQVLTQIILPALADRKGWLIVMGTPRGVDAFSKVYFDALEDPEWFTALLTVYDTDALDPTEVERLKAKMSDIEFAQEMLCSFEAANANTLIPHTDAVNAAHRVHAKHTYDWSARVLGVDCARYGDDESVIFPRQGLVAFKPKVLRKVNTMELAEAVALAAARFQADMVFVDVGGLGAGVYDRLTQLRVRCAPVDFGGSPQNPAFRNKRVEMWSDMALWLKAGGAIPNDTRLLTDLCAPTFDFKDAAGKMRLESKDDLKERGLPSPDRADALALTFAAPVAPSSIAYMNGLGVPIARKPAMSVTQYDVLKGE